MSQFAVNIVMYNSSATLDACLDALDAQTYRDFDIYLLDNASVDDTLHHAATRSDVELIIPSSTNIGYAAAHNQLIDHSSSEYILTLNPDVVLDSQYLAEIAAVLDSDPRLGSASGCLLRVDRLDETPGQIDSAGLYMRRNRQQRLRFEGLSIANYPRESVAIFGPDGAAACYRRAMLRDICLDGEVFDTDFFMHKEDVDVCWRAQLRGWSSVFVPDALGRHIRGFRPGQRQRVDARLRYYSVRNRYLLMLKNEQLRHFLSDSARILWFDLLIVGYLALFEQASLRAFLSVCRLFPKMLRKRHTIHAHRTVSWRALRIWFVQS